MEGGAVRHGGGSAGLRLEVVGSWQAAAQRGWGLNRRACAGRWWAMQHRGPAISWTRLWEEAQVRATASSPGRALPGAAQPLQLLLQPVVHGGERLLRRALPPRFCGRQRCSQAVVAQQQRGGCSPEGGRELLVVGGGPEQRPCQGDVHHKWFAGTEGERRRIPDRLVLHHAQRARPAAGRVKAPGVGREGGLPRTGTGGERGVAPLRTAVVQPHSLDVVRRVVDKLGEEGSMGREGRPSSSQPQPVGATARPPHLDERRHAAVEGAVGGRLGARRAAAHVT